MYVYAMQAAGGLITEARQLREAMMGVQYHDHMKNLLQLRSPGEFLADIRLIARKLFQESKIRYAINHTEADKEETLESYEQILETFWPKAGDPLKKCHRNSDQNSVKTLEVLDRADKWLQCMYSEKLSDEMLF